MKKILILCLFVAATTMANAQLRKEITSEKPTNKKTKSSDPLANFYGKALNYTLHKKGDTKIPHSVDQQITFAPDGTFIQTLASKQNKGSWVYSNESHILTLTFAQSTGGESIVKKYTIKEIQNTKIKLVDGNESLTLYILKKSSDSPVEISNTVND